MSTKKFLYTVFGVYAALAVFGVVLFHSPNYSGAYLAKYKHEQERRHHIVKSEAYKDYMERPLLHPADAKLKADIEFVQEYEARPEFRAEQSRIFAYNMYFKVLNAVVFVILLVWAIQKPAAGFLDGKVAEIRAELDGAEKARTEAERLRNAAAAKMDEWAVIESRLTRETDEKVQQNVAAIHHEFEEARADLTRETADRKQAELYRAARLLKEELVGQAIAVLEQRYRTEATQEGLAAHVDKFTGLMDRLS